MCKHKLFLMAAALAVMTSSAYADTMVSVNTTTADFEASKAKLVKELDSAQYREISPSDKDTVLKALDRIDERMSHRSATALSSAKRTGSRCSTTRRPSIRSPPTPQPIAAWSANARTILARMCRTRIARL